MPALRRAPVQQRSAERLTRILDACAEVIEEQGYEALTTSSVAERAGVPIGSVYRFFGNKRAMAEALAARNLDEYTARITRRLASDPGRGADEGADEGAGGGADSGAGGWRHIIDTMLDEYLTMKRTFPGFALLDFGAPVSPTEEADYANDRVAARLCALLAARLDLAVTDDLQRTCLVAVEAADALLQLAFRTDEGGDPALVAETRSLLHAYLARTLD